MILLTLAYLFASYFITHSCIGSNLEYSFTNSTKTSVSLATTIKFSSANEACNTILVSTSSWLQSNKYAQSSLFILHVCDVSVTVTGSMSLFHPSRVLRYLTKSDMRSFLLSVLLRNPNHFSPCGIFCLNHFKETCVDRGYLLYVFVVLLLHFLSGTYPLQY